MELARSMMIILLTGILTDNFVLSKFMGICPFLGVSKNPSSSLGMGCAVTAVMVGATAVTYPLYHAFLVPMNLEYMNTILFILIIALFVQVVEMVLKKYVKSLYNALGVYLPLITTNCAVLGVTLLNIESDYSFIESLVNALGAGFSELSREQITEAVLSCGHDANIRGEKLDIAEFTALSDALLEKLAEERGEMPC